MFLYNSIYYYRYMPKGIGKLHIYDQLPLMLPLLIRGPIAMGINLHWIPGPLRVKFVQFTVNLYQRTNPPEAFHMWYRMIKDNPSIGFATQGVRKYYLARCANVTIIPPEEWENLPLIWNTKYRPRYLRKTIY
jgi:hypothetical protein